MKSVCLDCNNEYFDKKTDGTCKTCNGEGEVEAEECFDRSDEHMLEWFEYKCNTCGYEGCSCKMGGGHQIADTGDYSDPLCARCHSNNID